MVTARPHTPARRAEADRASASLVLTLAGRPPAKGHATWEGGRALTSADPVLHHPPEPFDGIEMMAAMSRQEMAAKLSMVVVECCVALVRPVDPAPVDDHDDLFLGFAADRHDVMEILAQCLGINMRHDLREDFGGPILDRTHDAEQHATGDPTPRAMLHPCVPFPPLVPFDLTWTQRPCGQASTRGCAPPARPGEGKTPEDGFIFREHNALPLTSPILESREFERAVGEISRGRIKTPRGTAVGYGVFFSTSRTLARLSWTPVWRAKTVASS
jgi:hypothetical protein